ncbi:ATP-binding protein [Methylomicrobium agile]|uniref:ATP-binding protein n=1 Tax=Methylomicrobium agile TaxID=39774 RepID=UPI0004DF5EAE|nr:ATP-binding protein [Methylomicrobium agile]
MQGIILIGLQASGKTTFYFQQFAKTHIRLSMDMLKTRHRENLLLHACLEAKQPVVIDNTNPTRQERGKYIKGFKTHRFEVIGYYFSANLEACLKRNALRTGKGNIPEAGLKGTYNKLELPEYAEGFDQLYYVSIHHNHFKVEGWKHEIQ